MVICKTSSSRLATTAHLSTHEKSTISFQVFKKRDAAEVEGEGEAPTNPPSDPHVLISRLFPFVNCAYCCIFFFVIEITMMI